jgi:hypothetical protein
MYVQIEKPKENKSRTVANSVGQKKSNVRQGFGFVDNRLKSTITGVDAVTQKQENKDTFFVDNRSKEVAQRSWTGKAGTLLGTALVGGLASLALPAILPIAASTAAIAGGLGYLGYKSKYGVPFIGGRTNLDTLQEGKGSTGKVGVGLSDKKHLFSHSVSTIGNEAYDQRVTEGDIDHKTLLKTLYSQPTKKTPKAKLYPYATL